MRMRVSVHGYALAQDTVTRKKHILSTDSDLLTPAEGKAEDKRREVTARNARHLEK